MSRRSRPPYRSGLEWILGVAFEDTLTRPARLAQGFTCVRCCGSPRASSPHGLTAPAPASHDDKYCVQLPPTRGCYHLAPRRTFTSNPVPMPGTPPSVPTPMRQRQQTRQDATYRSRKSVQMTGASSRLGPPEQPSDAQCRASHLTVERTYGLTIQSPLGPHRFRSHASLRSAPPVPGLLASAGEDRYRGPVRMVGFFVGKTQVG